MMLFLVALAALALAVLPAALLVRNLQALQPAPQWPPATPWRSTPAALPEVAVLIPARDEARSIEGAIASALAAKNARVRVLVLDDHSTDETGEIVARCAAVDPRVTLLAAPPLPAQWCGKQHACHFLASQTELEWLLWMDADVRLAPDAVGRLVAFAEDSGAALVSGFPHQQTGTLFERLLIPLMHFVLLGFLPIERMRASTHPAYAAGCGQLFLARRAEYWRAGGHAAIRQSLHDGIMLPRAFRRQGLPTDLCDATDLATCRMYRSAGEVWNGLAKNAHEGLGQGRLIVPATLLLFAGQVLPALLAMRGVLIGLPWVTWGVVILGLAASLGPRLALAVRFRQSRLGAILHPVGVSLLLAIQWYALARRVLGFPPAWKGRRYAVRAAASPDTPAPASAP